MMFQREHSNIIERWVKHLSIHSEQRTVLRHFLLILYFERLWVMLQIGSLRKMQILYVLELALKHSLLWQSGALLAEKGLPARGHIYAKVAAHSIHWCINEFQTTHRCFTRCVELRKRHPTWRNNTSSFPISTTHNSLNFKIWLKWYIWWSNLTSQKREPIKYHAYKLQVIIS